MEGGGIISIHNAEGGREAKKFKNHWARVMGYCCSGYPGVLGHMLCVWLCLGSVTWLLSWVVGRGRCLWLMTFSSVCLQRFSATRDSSRQLFMTWEVIFNGCFLQDGSMDYISLDCVRGLHVPVSASSPILFYWRAELAHPSLHCSTAFKGKSSVVFIGLTCI